MDSRRIKLLQTLVDSFGPSGFEREVSTIVAETMRPISDEISIDKLGSVHFMKKGSADHPRILIAGHIDEVGFIVSAITEEGFLKVNPLGGWWDQVILGQKVVVQTRKGQRHFGVFGAKPPHLLEPDERKKVVELKQMFIDVGASSEEDVKEMGIQIGDPIMPDASFQLIRNEKLAAAKAFDDRLGAFIAMEVVRQLKEQNINHPNTIIGAATVQEEVGLRGARTTAHVVEPDVGFALEVEIAGDMPGIKPEEAASKLGKGPAISTMDRSMIPNQSLLEFVIDTAEKEDIPYQLSAMYGGATDAGVIHLNRAGVPSLVIGVPTRHIHSHIGILNLDDIEKTIDLLIAVIKAMNTDIVKSFTNL
ncbi:MAG: M42 family metallopeptidase [Candidatus Hodarchaeota archaeon]